MTLHHHHHTGRQNGIYLLLIKISESITSEWCKSFPIPTLVKQSLLSLLSKIPSSEIFSSVTFRKKQTQNFTKQIKVSHKSKFLSWTLFKKKNDEKSQFFSKLRKLILLNSPLWALIAQFFAT